MSAVVLHFFPAFALVTEYEPDDCVHYMVIQKKGFSNYHGSGGGGQDPSVRGTKPVIDGPEMAAALSLCR